MLWQDNLHDLEKRFELREVPCPGCDEPLSMYFCRKCGKKASWTREESFECQNGQIIPVKVVCGNHPCKNRWKLEVCPGGEIRKQS